ncbi:hypothetical protein S1361_01325 [Streptomyces cyanogenus]|uniref:Insertion element IS402-like domain-containing protein n=1 Tax=Streptomyces cyanogenus TaxID=80860 RepID=A0ABX7THT3_STRCY|nr:hypothetical protein S1361_01325 [Streptomyces cyanogenus]
MRKDRPGSRWHSRRYPGRKALPDRDVLCGLHTGIQWECLPKELGFGSGMTCWRRLRDWTEAGVWGNGSGYPGGSARSLRLRFSIAAPTQMHQATQLARRRK